MKILKNILLLVVVVLVSYFLSNYYFDGLYKLFFFETQESLFYTYEAVAKFFIVFVLTFTFFLTLLFTAFGDAKKYWWVGILLIPAVIFEVAFDIQHIYIPVILGLAGWGIGLGINKLTTKI